MPTKTKRISPELGAKIRILRQQKGWTQEKLSNRCGMTRHAIYEIETQTKKPSFVLICKIAIALGMTPDSLFFGTSTDEDKIFMHHYSSLRPETKKHLFTILKAMKKTDNKIYKNKGEKQ